MGSYALGLDFGTNSMRALLVDLTNGDEVAGEIAWYPSGDDGVILDSKDPNVARQHPGDYVHAMRVAIPKVIRTAAIDPKQIVGIGVDTTGSSPMPVDANGTPLGMLPHLADEPNAQCWLWKDHTSFAEAAEITQIAQDMGLPYLAKCGGTYSSEWFWSKILHCALIAPDVFSQAHSWVEIADWIPAYLVGRTDPTELRRGICAAGHKAMFHRDWGGLPSTAFLRDLDPRLAELRERLYTEAHPSSALAGHVSAQVAQEMGLAEGTPVAVGAFDAHMGAVGSGIRPGTLVKIIGTSTCDCMVHPLSESLPDIPGLCGIVPESILPGCHGLEAGQSAVGDIFNWWADLCGATHEALTNEAARLTPGESGLVALDWNNGNRTILVNPLLSGLLVGQTLHTTRAEVYRALIEATAFGALTIIRRIEEYGVKVSEVVNCGGIAEKNPLVMQIYADVCDRPMKVSRSSQTCALGAAIFGAVAADHFEKVEEAQELLCGVKSTVYEPNPDAAARYQELYSIYLKVHDAFGLGRGEIDEVMRELRAIARQARIQ